VLELEEWSFDDLSELKCRIHGVLDDDRETHVAVVSFEGVYGVGSEGNDDAAYMRGMVLAVLSAWDVAGLVLDLRKLEYSWGYALLGVIEAAGELRDQNESATFHFPVLIVTADDCHKGVESLLESATESFGDILHSSLDAAVTAANNAVGDYLEMTDPGITLTR